MAHRLTLTKRPSRWLLVILAAIAVVICSLGLLSLSYFRAPESRVAGLVPPRQSAFLSVFVHPSYEQMKALGDLLETTGAERVLDGDDPLGSLLDPFLERAGFSYSQDVDPWLGREIGVAVTESVEGGRDLIGVLEVEHAEVADERLRSVGGAITGSYRGVQYRRPSAEGRDGSPGWSVGRMSEHVVIASSSEAFEAAVDAHRGRSLEDEASYQEFALEVPADRLGLVFVQDVKSIDPRASLPPPLRFIVGAMFLGGRESLGAGLWAEPEALVVESSGRQPIRINARVLGQIIESSQRS